jgi:hypothetical protein
MSVQAAKLAALRGWGCGTLINRLVVFLQVLLLGCVTVQGSLTWGTGVVQWLVDAPCGSPCLSILSIMYMVTHVVVPHLVIA